MNTIIYMFDSRMERFVLCMRPSLYFAVCLAGFLLSITTARAAVEGYKLSIGTHVISAELAMTNASRAQGLMHRRQLCANCGMLFVFPSEDKWSFWSKNTPLALSVAFIDKSGGIIGISDMEPDSLDIHTSPGNVVYALEMPRGWFSKNNIRVGNSFSGWVNGPPELGRQIHAQ
ncbi:MAG: DUF192 domain-containing protein [Gallionella sp.]